MFIKYAVAFGLLLTTHASFAQESWVQPYLGIADSPFQEFGMLDTLILEDFEDQELNVPGVTLQPNDTISGGQLRITSSLDVSTPNSITEDTGDPETGFFLLGTPASCSITYPPLCPATATLTFDEPYPSFVGFAWTDAVRSTIPQSGLPYGLATAINSLDEVAEERIFDRAPFNPENMLEDDIFVAFVDHSGIKQLQFTVVIDESGGHLTMDHLQFGQVAIPGDTDRNGVVEFEDFLTLSDNFGEEGSWSDGDFNFDGQVTFPDFLQLSRNYGREFGASAVAVPEAIEFSLAYLLLMFAFRRKRRS